jgi:ribosomal protein L32
MLGVIVQMHLFAKECPHCGKTKAYHRIPSSRYAPAAPIAFGGVSLALIFSQSRKPQFRCELCGTTFSSHTITSRFFWLFWVFLVFITAVLWLLIFSS